MSSRSVGEKLAGMVRQERTGTTLQDQVAQLFLESRDDVYRYLLNLGLFPPQAQIFASESRITRFAPAQET